MSEELREKVCRFCFKFISNPNMCPCLADIDDRNACKIFKDIKQWAKDCVPKEKEYISLENMEGRHNIDGHNQCRAETLKKIEEA